MTCILVCGGRFYHNADRVNAVLDAAVTRLGLTEICHGAATGADALAAAWAKARGVKATDFPADWSNLDLPDALIRTRHNGTKYDAKAGGRRNQLMLETMEPTIVIAFPGGYGTTDMVTRAERAGTRVIKIDWEDAK